MVPRLHMVPLFTPSLVWKGRQKVMKRLSLPERTDVCPKLTASKKKSATDLAEFEVAMILTNNNQELRKCIGAALLFVEVAYILAVIPVRSTFGTKAITECHSESRKPR